MNKIRNKNNIKQISSPNYHKISQIEFIVDEILLKNKDRLDKIQSKEIDVEKFSLKNKKGDIFYYLRKKSHKKRKNAIDSKELSKIIISEARANLGKDPLEIEYKINIPSKNFGKIRFLKHKKRIKFGNRNKKYDKEHRIKSPTIDDHTESEEFVEIVSKIERIENKTQKQIDDDEKIIDKKIMEIHEMDNFHKDSMETKSTELAKKYNLISKEKTSESKKDVDRLSSSTENLADLKKKYEKNLIISGLDTSHSDKLSDDESKFIDDKIKESPITEDSTEKIKESLKISDSIEKVDIGEYKPSKPLKKFLKFGEKKEVETPEVISLEDKDKVKAAKPLKKFLKYPGKKEVKIIKEYKNITQVKKSFFKRKKPFDKKEANLKKIETKPDELKSIPMFRVDNIPQSSFNESEKKLVEENIMKSSNIIGIPSGINKGEAEASKLASEHIKDKTMPITGKEITADKKVKKDIENQKDIIITEGDSEHEHIFFDEEESSSGGWSPQIIDKEKKKILLPITSQGEIDTDESKGIGEVELPKELFKTRFVKLSDLGFLDREWEELDFYPIQEPFAYVEILREKESLDKCYFLVEISLTEEEENLISFIRETMANLDIDAFEMEEKNQDEYLLERLNQIFDEYNININEESKNKIHYYMSKSSIGLDKIDSLMRDPNIEDISCDGSGVPIFLYHRKYGSLKSNIRFTDEEELSSFIFKLAQKCGKHISIAEPMLDATMPDGSRIQMTLSDEITAKGSTFTIRKFRSDPFSPPDLIEFNTMSSEMIAYMWIAVENGINTLFAGGTASGKTTALNALTLFIPRESKIVSIEETREINLPHPNWIPGVARSGFGEVVADKVVGEIDMYDLMKAALRQRPEYILVGEIRGKEAYVLFQAMATGHATYSTVHADSAQSLIHRLEGKPINIPRIMLQSLDIVCLHVITRVKNIRARRCKQIIEIIDIDPTTKEILTNEVFRWDPVEDKFVYTGKSYVLERLRAEKDITREKMTNEIKNRKKILEWMNENNVREFRDVANLIARYNEDPEETLEKIEKGVKKIDV